MSCNVALNNKKMENKTWYLSAYNEIFINPQQNYFDRNRLYGGIGYKFSDLVRSEVGFMNQASSNTSRSQLNLITFVSF